MEFLDEVSRYEEGGLIRDFDLPLAVAAMQLLGIEPPEPSPQAS